MGLLKAVIKILIILAAVAAMVLPVVFEFITFGHDKKNKITYKRLRVVIYTVIYFVAVTVALILLTNLSEWLSSLSFIQWLSDKISVSSRTVFFKNVYAAILANFAIGLLYVFFSKFVRIRLKDKDITASGKNGVFLKLRQFERRVIKFFYTETWFFVGTILKYLTAGLSAIYILMFIAFQLPAVFSASWIPYDFISDIFRAGYIYPMITLIVLWELYFFLEGIRRIEEECPGFFSSSVQITADKVDLKAVDDEVRKQFKDYYACDLDLSKTAFEEIPSTNHHDVTKYVGQSIEGDKRNPQKAKEIYLNCLDKMVGTESSILVNGSFFSEFSMYFLRYLSVIVARGDNVVFVCNNDTQIDEVYQYLHRGLSEISSLYSGAFGKEAVDFDDPIWRLIKISGENDDINEAAVGDNSILVTSLSYLCSTHFESQHSSFIHLIDTIVFVDSLKTVNTFNRQLEMFNTRLKHISRNNARLSKNGNINKAFNVRYMARPVRYICFDDTRTPGLDKVLKNLLGVEFESVDSMRYSKETLVRCYRYEGTVDENGRRTCPQYFDSEEEVGALMNIAVLCLAKGASVVHVFDDESIPYSNIAETIAANMGKVCIKADGSNIRLNLPGYNPDGYSVLIVMDSKNDLPATLRKYLSMVSDKPSLVIVFSKPYMMRDYYIDKIDEVWSSTLTERIPVERGTKKEIAQKILVKANAFGISENEILTLASEISEFRRFVEAGDINSILREILKMYGMFQEECLDLFKYFEYSSFRDFDENGEYCAEQKVLLRRQGKLFDIINGRDMVVMMTGDREIVLPVPMSRLTQKYIAGQNLLYNGDIYHINKIDTARGRIYARLAVGGKNDEAYQYIQSREYRAEIGEMSIESIFPNKHVSVSRKEDNVSVDDIFVSVFRAPMEVITKGYYVIDPHTSDFASDENRYYSISDPDNNEFQLQTYRRYGEMKSPLISSDMVFGKTNLISSKNGALMMSVRIKGSFGDDVNRTMFLASVMLNNIINSMFPSVADSVVVCPVLHSDISDDETKAIFEKQPVLTITGGDEQATQDFELVIIEDSPTDLGVVSVLMSAGDDVLNTLFYPVFNYLKWYFESAEKSRYLYYGLDKEPSCFDFDSLFKLSKILGDDKHDLKFVDLEAIVEYAVCDFCGKRYVKGKDDVVVLDDGRKMCRKCAESLVGNNKKSLAEHLERARIYLESTYGITVDNEYEFCFDSAVQIVNALKQNPNLAKRGSDIPLKSYIDDKKKVHVEYSLPSVNLSELLVRQLTHVWQIKNLPNLEAEYAEGLIALVSVQYLRFAQQGVLASSRVSYYESTDDVSGVGYRKLAAELIENPQYRNNPFLYLLEKNGGSSSGKKIVTPVQIIDTGDYGLSYTPEKPDRALDGNITYFYYSNLSDSKKRAYDILLKAIQNHEESAEIESMEFGDIVSVMSSIEYDHPELFWYRTFSATSTNVIFKYGCTAQDAEALQKRIDESAAKYLEIIDDSMSAYDVAIRLHAKVISVVDYDTIALNKETKEGGPSTEKIDYLRSICGVFLKKSAVCEGYARAMQYLLQKCGIECAEIVGYTRKTNNERGGAHAWNILKIDGDYYLLDTTWDDPSNTIQTVKTNYVGFNYFCVTTEEMSRSREPDLSPADIPDCEATRANYFYHNGCVLESYDLEKIKAIAQTAAKSGRTNFVFKCKTKEVFDEALRRLCIDGSDCYETLKAAAKINKKIQSDTYTYIYNDTMWTIKVNFTIR